MKSEKNPNLKALISAASPETVFYLTDKFHWTTEPEKDEKIFSSYSFKADCQAELKPESIAFPLSRAVQEWIDGDADLDDTEDLRNGIKKALEYAVGCDLCEDFAAIHRECGLDDAEDGGYYCSPDAEAIVSGTYGGTLADWRSEVRLYADEEAKRVRDNE